MLEIKNLVKVYENKKVAVNDISLSIKPGEVFGFIGHNGAGKTTTIKAIVGLVPITNGSITFNGLDVTKNSLEVKKQIAYIPDNPDLYDSLTAIQYLNFISDIFEISKEERIEEIEKYADIFKIKNNLGDLISSFSHGMKQKLALISALIHHPKLLILDEPFVGLDPKAAYDMKMIMKEMCKQGSSVFFSTHVLEVAEKLCDRIAIIADGKLVAYGSIEDVKGDSSLEHVFLETLKEG